MSRSVVIRGSISHQIKPTNHIEKTIDSIRSWFDGEIVICTWTEQESFLDRVRDKVDKIVLSYDPGPGPIQNILRQIVSFKEGVEACSGEEILVTRPDITFSKNVFDFLGKYPNRSEYLRFTDQKILVGNVMTINPDSFEIPNTFRVSDWFHCGKRSDIEKLYSGLNLVWGLDRKKLETVQTCTEKMWLLSILKENCLSKIDLYDSGSVDQFSWDAIMNNFIVLNSYSTLGTYNYNYPNQQENMYCYLTEQQYIERHESL